MNNPTKYLSWFLVLLSLPLLAGTPIKAQKNDNKPRISNGILCEECGFGPAVVSLRDSSVPYGCTGTLVHPQVVIYAAHCGDSFAGAEFTHSWDQGRMESFSYCKTNPDYDGNVANDFAYCLFDEPVLDIPYIPAAFGCELDDYMVEGEAVTLCGFGFQTDVDIDHNKYYGQSEIASIVNNTINVGPADGSVVACPGDSGSPLLGRRMPRFSDF